MSIVKTNPIPFAAFAPCDVQGCTTYADYEVRVSGGGVAAACDLCRNHLAAVRAAAKRGPDSSGAFLDADGRILWDTHGWRL